MTRTLLALATLLLLAAPATAAVKPKPWQWPPTKTSGRLVAAAPIMMIDARLESASCAGAGKGVAGRYSLFRCKVVFDNSGFDYPGTATVRVLPVGSGKLCIAAVSGGISIVTGRACA